MPPTALLIDLDGVVRRWKVDLAAIERRHRLPTGSILRVALAPACLHPAITGAITDDVWRAGIALELQQRHPDASAQRAVAEWSASSGEVDPLVLRALDRCRLELRVVLATNATSRLSADLLALGLADRFHAIANSSELRVAKPSAEYFNAALRIAGAGAKETLFVDDAPVNVEAAAAAGMRAHLFTGHAALSAFLEAAGALSETRR